MARSEALNICYDRILPSDPLPGDMTSVQRLALVVSKMWEPGDKLTVSFIGGTATQRQHAIDSAKRIEKIANINYEFVTGTTSGMVRIAFNSSLGAWSFMGKDILSVSRSQPTMNLGFDQPGTYTHEHLHNLAAIHEHQNPDSNPIRWNREQVYHDLGGPPNNWDRATIDSNMFAVYDRTQINGTAFDKLSVMLYSFPATWTLDGFKADSNAVLSPEDIRWLRTKLPGRPVDPGTPPVPPTPPTTGAITIPEVTTALGTIRDSIIARNPSLNANQKALLKTYVTLQNKDLATKFAGRALKRTSDNALRAFKGKD